MLGFNQRKNENSIDLSIIEISLLGNELMAARPAELRRVNKRFHVLAKLTGFAPCKPHWSTSECATFGYFFVANQPQHRTKEY